MNPSQRITIGRYRSEDAQRYEVVLILCGFLLFAIGIIAFPIKLVLMLFYPLPDVSVPVQTVAQYFNLSLAVIRWEVYLAAIVLIAAVFMGGIAVASALLTKSIGNVFLSFITQITPK